MDLIPLRRRSILSHQRHPDRHRRSHYRPQSQPILPDIRQRSTQLQIPHPQLRTVLLPQRRKERSTSNISRNRLLSPQLPSHPQHKCSTRSPLRTHHHRCPSRVHRPRWLHRYHSPHAQDRSPHSLCRRLRDVQDPISLGHRSTRPTRHRTEQHRRSAPAPEA